MVMPLLKGLVGSVQGINEEPAGSESTAEEPIAMTLDDLTPDELEALQADAEAALADGSLDSVLDEDEGEPSDEADETAEDEAAETPEEQAAEDEAGTELHSTTEYVEQAQAGAEECESLLEQLGSARDELEDPAMAKSIVAQAEAAASAVEDIAEEAEDALDEDNINAAASAVTQIDQIKDLLKEAIAAVQQMARDTGSPVGGEVDDKSKSAKSKAKPEKEPGPLSIWANKVAGKG